MTRGAVRCSAWLGVIGSLLLVIRVGFGECQHNGWRWRLGSVAEDIRADVMVNCPEKVVGKRGLRADDGDVPRVELVHVALDVSSNHVEGETALGSIFCAWVIALKIGHDSRLVVCPPAQGRVGRGRDGGEVAQKLVERIYV